MIRTYNLALVFCFLASTIIAQERFGAGILAGLNLAQIDGDDEQGYRKVGANIGVRGSIYLKQNFDISAELFYNQKGARPKNVKDDPFSVELFPTFKLQYADVVAMANLHLSPQKELKYFRHTAHMGLSFGRLIKSQTDMIKSAKHETALEAALTEGYNRNDFSFVVGWSWYIKPQWGFSARHIMSITPLYNRNGRENVKEFDVLRPYNLSLQFFYNFITPKNIWTNKKNKKEKEKNSPLEDL